jgi:hypothetical protein
MVTLCNVWVNEEALTESVAAGETVQRMTSPQQASFRGVIMSVHANRKKGTDECVRPYVSSY